MQKLLNFGGFGHALPIMDQHKNLTLQTDVPDKLMFTWATNGQRPVLGQRSISHDETNAPGLLNEKSLPLMNHACGMLFGETRSSLLVLKFSYGKLSTKHSL